jgi:hypothetical protein
MRLSRFSVLSVLTIAVSACASSGSSGAPRAAQSSPDYVTSIEIDKTPASNAYELIDRLRPRWLQAPAAGSLSGSVRTQVIAVYLDGFRVGAKEGLRSISAAGIKSMRYYDAARAATVLHEVGSEPIAGAIVITTTQSQ